MEYKIQDQVIELELNQNVFQPSPHGVMAFGNVIKVNPGETVLDVGTGSGLLAIFAAKLGGKVTAIDIVSDAVELTKKNAEKNNVSLDVKMGNLFSPVEGNVYDVIIANVPQENLSPNIINSMSSKEIIGIFGQENGNALLIETLKTAARFMHKNSRLYVAVYSLSNFRESLKVLLDNYNAKLLNFYSSPVKDFVYSDLEYYEIQNKKGNINIYKNNDKYWADVFSFELSLK